VAARFPSQYGQKYSGHDVCLPEQHCRGCVGRFSGHFGVQERPYPYAGKCKKAAQGIKALRYDLSLKNLNKMNG